MPEAWEEENKTVGKIVLTGIDKFYGANHVLKNLDLVIEDGDFMTLLGPSGCGKTTTLRVIAGLEKPQNGIVYIDNREVVNAKEQFFETPGKRNLALVFQSYALWPHMTVFDNVAFGLKANKVDKSKIKQMVNEALQRLRIAELSGRYPSELSGGQQQRVAIARSIVMSSKVLLLDEPLSNLDAKLRMEMRVELKRLHQEMGITIIYVTHDQVEALTMSTRIAVFFEGVMEQVNTPLEVYHNPVSLRVADFIGNPRINFLQGKAQKSGDSLKVESSLGVFRFGIETFTEFMCEDGVFDCIVGVRPEQILISRDAVEGGIPAKVYSCMPAGSETLMQLSIAGEKGLVLAKRLGSKNYNTDQNVWLKINSDVVNVFHKESGKLIIRAVSVAGED